MGDRGHNRHGPKRGGLLCPLMFNVRDVHVLFCFFQYIFNEQIKLNVCCLFPCPSSALMLHTNFQHIRAVHTKCRHVPTRAITRVPIVRQITFTYDAIHGSYMCLQVNVSVHSIVLSSSSSLFYGVPLQQTNAYMRA